MTLIIIIISIIVWLYIGYKGFVYSWTKFFDFTSREVRDAYLFSLLGPFTWLIHYITEPYEDIRVLVKKRDKTSPSGLKEGLTKSNVKNYKNRVPIMKNPPPPVRTITNNK